MEKNRTTSGEELFDEDILDPQDIRVTVQLDDGTTAECAIVNIFTALDRDYIALLPLDAQGNPNEDWDVFIYRYQEDEEGTPSLSNIETDEEYEIVADRFDEIQDEEAFDEMP